MGVDRRIARRGDDALIRRQKVVCVGVGLRDAPDHRRPGDELIAVRQEVRHQVDVAGIALDEAIARMAVVLLPHRAILGEIVQPDYLMPLIKELLNHVVADETRGASDQDPAQNISHVAGQAAVVSRDGWQPELHINASGRPEDASRPPRRSLVPPRLPHPCLTWQAPYEVVAHHTSDPSPLSRLLVYSPP